MRLTEQDRFWLKVEAATPEGCWLWTGGTKAAGYGHFSVQRNGRWGKVLAHRFAYELLVGPIPPGLEADHVCGTPPCVNPAHIEPVTIAENRRRRDKGHPFALTRPVLPLPPRPQLPVVMPPTSREPPTHCRNGHEYAAVGWASNGANRVCAGCRGDAAARRRAKSTRRPHGTETHCPHGHPYSGDNLWERVRTNGQRTRECRECHRQRNRRT